MIWRRLISYTVHVFPAAALALLSGGGSAPARAADADLRVTRLALFNSGVGYFECNATVNDSSVAELKFRTEQINDIIKSLVVQDFGGGSIGAVGYASRDPIEKTLRSFAVDITGKPTLAQLLDQLRGEAVEISGPTAARGVIVGVEKRRKQVSDTAVVEVDVVNILTENAGLVQLDIAELAGVRFLNEAIRNELTKALTTLASSHDADKKAVTIEFNGTGQRRVRAAYLLETPIWKTSYRLVLADERKPDSRPFLQGWATVENATEEDWNDVQLSLVSGRPISFRMDLYTPIYVPRPLEQLELYASLRPPEYAGGFEEKAKNIAGDDRRAGGARGAVGRRLEAKSAAPPPAAAPADMADRDAFAEAGEQRLGLALQDMGVASVASAQDAGELFEYVIREPVSIGRQRSAMLPIVNQAVSAEKVSIYNPATHALYPLNGLIFTNTTDLNLMQGPVTIFDGDVYAGDAKLPDLKPQEKRLVGYALDLATEVMVESKSHPDVLVALKVVKGVLFHTHRYVDERQYTIKNKADKDRRVILEQPVSGDWKLVEPGEAYEKAPGLLRFRVAAPAGQTVTQAVRLEWVRDEQVLLSNLDINAIGFYLRSSVASEKFKQAMQRVIELRNELDVVARQRAEAERAVNEATAEQGRIRENLKTLDKGSDSYRKQLAKFDELENTIERSRGTLATLRDQEEVKRAALEQYLAGLEIS